MHVLIDGIIFETTGVASGVWRVYYELLRRLGRRHEITLLLRDEPRLPLPEGCHIVRDDARKQFRRRDVGARSRALLSRWLTPRRLGRQDLFQSTFFTDSPAAGIPTVVTVHDMIPEFLPYRCNQQVLIEQIQAKRRSVAGAARILAISRATSDDLGAMYPEASSRVTIMHLGADHLARPPDRGHCPPRRESGRFYCLFVGYRFGYKNFEVVLQALTNEAWPADVDLVIAGGELSDVEKANLARLEVFHRVHDAGRVPDSELAELYRGASCFVFPSLKEGFGLPVVEAQNQGCPVICSDIPCFREVAGDSALFFDAVSPQSLAVQVHEARNSKTRQRMQDAGYENLNRFSWDRAAETVSEVYRTAV